MSIQRVKAYLKQFGADGRVQETAESSATVELAAAALHTEPARIAKTLSFKIGDPADGGRVLLVVCAGDGRVDNKKFKQQFGVKPRMLSHEEVGPLIGHDVGGVCPFGVNPGVEVYLEEGLRRFQTVWPAAGSSNSMIELTIPELERFSGSLGWVSVCKEIG